VDAGPPRTETGAATVRVALGGAAATAGREPVNVAALVGMGAPRESFAVSHARLEGDPEVPERQHTHNEAELDAGM
jgi:hypothetical protein